MSTTLSATVVITTKNRKDELRGALTSAFVQSAQPEVIVIDDGSTDGTSEMVRREFPLAVLHRSNLSRGLVIQRNAAAQIATGDILFSIDDDAEFSTAGVVAQTLHEFDSPRIGAVAIPYIEPQNGNRMMQHAPTQDDIWVADRFVGTAHAVRRDVFLELGGYREHLIHQGEESDFCIRMLDAGWVVRVGTANLIIHHESPKRDFRRMDFYGTRNSVLFAWQNVPIRSLPIHLLATTIRCLSYSSFKIDRLRVRASGLLDGYWRFCKSYRQPVSDTTYRLFRRLRKSGPLPLSEIEILLHPIDRKKISAHDENGIAVH